MNEIDSSGTVIRLTSLEAEKEKDSISETPWPEELAPETVEELYRLNSTEEDESPTPVSIDCTVRHTDILDSKL